MTQKQVKTSKFLQKILQLDLRTSGHMSNKYGYEEVEGKHPRYGYELAEQPKNKLEIYKPPRKQGFREKLPKNIKVGLTKGILNQPYELAKNIEEQGNKFGKSINKTLPMEKYIGNNPESMPKNAI